MISTYYLVLFQVFMVKEYISSLKLLWPSKVTGTPLVHLQGSSQFKCMKSNVLAYMLFSQIALIQFQLVQHFFKSNPLIYLSIQPKPNILRYLIKKVKNNYFLTAFDLTPAKRKILDEPESTRMLSNHFKELNSTAILLIRNPFKAIIGHRHLDEGGHTGHASPKSFMGRGKYQSWQNLRRGSAKILHSDKIFLFQSNLDQTQSD